MNSSPPATTASEDIKDDSPAEPCFRKIGLPAVAGALCCARMPAPADGRVDKRGRDDANAGEHGDYWAEEEQPWFGVP
jgi:hypothetical protein